MCLCRSCVGQHLRGRHEGAAGMLQRVLHVQGSEALVRCIICAGLYLGMFIDFLQLTRSAQFGISLFIVTQMYYYCKSLALGTMMCLKLVAAGACFPTNLVAGTLPCFCIHAFLVGQHGGIVAITASQFSFYLVRHIQSPRNCSLA